VDHANCFVPTLFRNTYAFPFFVLSLHHGTSQCNQVGEPNGDPDCPPPDVTQMNIAATKFPSVWPQTDDMIIAIPSDPAREQDVDQDIQAPYYISPLTGDTYVPPTTGPIEFGGFVSLLTNAYNGAQFSVQEAPPTPDGKGGRTGVVVGANWQVTENNNYPVGTNRFGVFGLAHKVSGVHVYLIEATVEGSLQDKLDALNAMRTAAAQLPAPAFIAGDFNATFSDLTGGVPNPGELWLSNQWMCTNTCDVYDPNDIMNYLLVEGQSNYVVSPIALQTDPDEAGTTCSHSPPYGQIIMKDSTGNGIAHVMLGGVFNMCNNGCGGPYACVLCDANSQCVNNKCVLANH
jgi:hypothetical protein